MLLVAEMKNKVSDVRLQAFITGNLLSFLAGEVSDKYFIDFLKIFVTKDYMRSIPRFSNVLLKLNQLLSFMQNKESNRDEVIDLVDQILNELVT